MKKSFIQWLSISCALVILSNLLAGVAIAIVFGGVLEITFVEMATETLVLTIVLYLLGRWVESDK